MNTNVLTQDEIDILISHNLNELDSIETTRLSGSSMITPQMMSTVKTMLNRYYYALTHCGFEEQRIARDNLRKMAFKIWLCRYGFTDKTSYVKFVNKEAEKRKLGWKFCV